MSDPQKRAEIQARNRAYQEENKEHLRVLNREWDNNNRDKKRESLLRWKYGITIEEWTALFQQQGCCCALCGVSESGPKTWHTDHDHETGQVRGVLCQQCNLLLGKLGDSAASVVQKVDTILLYLQGDHTAWLSAARARQPFSGEHFIRSGLHV